MFYTNFIGGTFFVSMQTVFCTYVTKITPMLCNILHIFV